MKKLFLLVIFLSITAYSVVAEITKEELPNGVTLLMKRDTTTDVVALSMFRDIGLGDESENMTGITELTNRLLFEGRKTRSGENISDEFEFIGGVLKMTTSVDFSTIEMKILNEHIEPAFEMLHEIIANPTFPEEEFEREKKQMRDELQSKKNSPEIVAYELFLKSMFDGHYYAHPIEGYEETIARIKREDVEKYYWNNYFSRMVVAVVGNFVPEQIREEVGKIKHLQNREKQVLVPQRRSPSRVEKTADVESSFVYVGFDGPEISSEDYVAMKVVEALLGTGMSSRLFQELRDKQGLAYSFRSTLSATKLQGYFAVITVTKFLDKTIEGIMNEVTKLQKENVGEDELKQVKQKIQGRYVLGRESSDAQAYHLGFYEIMGRGYEFGEQYSTIVEAVTADDLVRVSEKYVTSPTITIVKPAS